MREAQANTACLCRMEAVCAFSIEICECNEDCGIDGHEEYDGLNDDFDDCGASRFGVVVEAKVSFIPEITRSNYGVEPVVTGPVPILTDN